MTDDDYMARLRADSLRLHQRTMELNEDARRWRRLEPWLPFVAAALFLASVYASAKWFLPLVSSCG